MSYCLKYACVSRKGKRRSNEDNFSINGLYLDRDHEDSPCQTGNLILEKPYTFAVFDGLSGECDGVTASWTGARYLSEHIGQIHDKDNSFMIKKEIGQLCLEINREICDYAANRKYSNMGTTMAGLTFFKDRVYGYNLGDSRIYSFSGGRLIQCSKDHVCGNLFMKKGLSQYLGIPESEFVVCPDIFSNKIQENEGYLICSDGLYKAISEEIMEDILRSFPSPEESLNRMFTEADEIGMEDNVTCILIHIGNLI